MKYLVNLVAYCSVVVEAESQEEAQDIAFNETSLYEFEIDSAECKDILDTKEKEDRAYRHCNAVIN